MSTIIVAAILVGSIVALFLLLASIDNKQKRKRLNQLRHRLSQSGSNNNMTFSSQEILKHSVLALDGLQRKLLVLNEIDKDKFDDFVIDLREIKTCFVKKHYGNARPGLKKIRPELYLERIVLRFEFNNAKQPIELLFYRHILDNVNQLEELEQKAKHWEAILSKMLGTTCSVARS